MVDVPKEAQITLGYWKSRGRGQVLRLLLSYVGLPWKQTTYEDASKWYGSGDSSKLGLSFPNLPYLIDGEFKISEPNAIAKYIIKKSTKKELLGKTLEDEATIEMILSVLDEIFNPTYSLFFSPNHEKEKVRLFDGKVKPKLEELVKFIGNKDFVIGYLTLLDFKIAEISYYLQKMYGDLCKNYAVLFKIRKVVEGIPEVKEYYKKNDAIKSPYLPEYAQLKF